MKRSANAAVQTMGVDVPNARLPERSAVDEPSRSDPVLCNQYRLVIEEVLACHASTADLPLTTRMCLARDIQRALEQSGALLAGRQDRPGTR